MVNPTERARIEAALKRDFDRLSPKVQLVARYILDHPQRFGLDPIRQTAANTGVSTNTLVRLAQQLGYAAFDDLRAPFRQALAAEMPEHGGDEWIEGVETQGAVGRIHAEALRSTLALVRASLRNLSVAQVDDIQRLILAAGTVYVTGAGAAWPMALHLAHGLRMVRRNTRLAGRDMGSPLEDLIDLGPNDVVIALDVRPSSPGVLRACRRAREVGARLVVITDGEAFPAEIRPDLTITAATVSGHGHASHTGILAVLECVLAGLVQRSGIEAESRMRLYETLRRQADGA